jgi:hypothetical protein
MPGGINDPGLGYATFCAVKFAGYTAAAHVLSIRYDGVDHAAWKVGAVRTLIGMVAGALYLGLWLVIDGPAHFGARPMDNLSYRYLAGLLPVRIGEWWLLIWLFYDRSLIDIPRGWRMVTLGTLWSYVLDAPAIFGFIATAGIWIC